MRWNEDRLALVRELADKGLPASLIAQSLYKQTGERCTRNAVIGVCDRKLIRLSDRAYLRMQGYTLVWTQEKERLLREGIAAGRTVKEISAEICISESTIYRRFRELHLKRPRQPSVATTSAPAPVPTVNVPSYLGGKKFEDLRPRECRFELGGATVDEFLFCAEPTPEGRSYCAHHHALAYRPSMGRKSRSCIKHPGSAH